MALEKCLSYLWTLFILHKPFHYLNDLLGGHSCLHDGKTSHLPMILELVVGMPIMCTKFFFGPKEVINDTLGHVIGCQLPKIATTHHQVIDETFGYIIFNSSMLPAIIFIKLFGHDQVLDYELPLDIIGIHPILEQHAFIKLPNQSFIVFIEQIPIVPTFALIVDKCQ